MGAQKDANSEMVRSMPEELAAPDDVSGDERTGMITSNRAVKITDADAGIRIFPKLRELVASYRTIASTQRQRNIGVVHERVVRDITVLAVHDRDPIRPARTGSRRVSIPSVVCDVVVANLEITPER